MKFMISSDSLDEALVTEKQMKAWKRQWKMRLVDHSNPEWKDLSEGFI